MNQTGFHHIDRPIQADILTAVEFLHRDISQL